MNRRNFLRDFGIYVAATMATCGGCRTAFGGMFPGQKSDSTGGGNSMFPKSETLTPPELQSPQVSQPKVDKFGIEGCSFYGDIGSRFRFVRSSGIPQVDQAVFGEANHLLRVTGMQPSLAFLDDRRSKNAVAFNKDVIARRSSHGAVALGVQLIQHLLELPTGKQQLNPLCIQAVLVHEWAHIAQFAYDIRATSVKYTELMADFMAGWYLGYKDTFVGGNVDSTPVRVCMTSMGDTNFNNPAHHGSPSERLGAFASGFEYVKGGHAGGLGGGRVGGFFTGGGGYGHDGFGGGYGTGRKRPPHFREAFAYARQKYIP